MAKSYRQLLDSTKPEDLFKNPKNNLTATGGPTILDMMHQEQVKKGFGKILSPLPSRATPTTAEPDATSSFEPSLDTVATDEAEVTDDSTEESAETNADDPAEEDTIRFYMKRLGDKLRAAAPHIDFTGDYQKFLKENPRPERKNINPLKAFAVALGGGDKAVSQLQDTHNAREDDTDKRWQDMMTMKEAALKGDIQQKMDEGKFKQALAQTEELAKMHAALDRITGARAHKEKLDEIVQTNMGKTDVAEIRRQTELAKQRFTTNLFNQANDYKLEGDKQREFIQQGLEMFSKQAAMQDITGQPLLDSDQLDELHDRMELWASKHGVNTRSGLHDDTDKKTLPPAQLTPAQQALETLRKGK